MVIHAYSLAIGTYHRQSMVCFQENQIVRWCLHFDWIFSLSHCFDTCVQFVQAKKSTVMTRMILTEMASVTRGYHEYRRGILLKAPINPNTWPAVASVHLTKVTQFLLYLCKSEFLLELSLDILGISLNASLIYPPVIPTKY